VSAIDRGCASRLDSVAELAAIVRATGGDKLADRLERALGDEVKLLGLEIDERAIILARSTARRTVSPSCAGC
jgi:hypothetical protein